MSVRRSRKIAVLQVGPAPPQLGGMETFIGDLYHSHLSEVYDLTLLNIGKPCLKKSGAYNIKTGYAGSFLRNPFISISSYFSSFRFFLKYCILLISQPIHIIHIHTASYTSFWEKCAYILVGKVFFKQVVLHIHGAMFSAFFDNAFLVTRRMIRRFLRMCDAVIVLSETWKKYFDKICYPQHVHIVENGINLEPFTTLEIERTESPSVLYMHEVSKRKGIFDLLQVIQQLNVEGFAFHFDIVGAGKLDQVREKIKNMEIARNITIHGPKYGAEKFDFFRKNWILILPSYAEGLPISIIEAFAAGMPVVSTRVGGIPDLVHEEENGFLSAPGRIHEIVNNLKRILTNSELCKKISANNLKISHEKYDIEQCADKIIAIYKSLP